MLVSVLTYSNSALVSEPWAFVLNLVSVLNRINGIFFESFFFLSARVYTEGSKFLIWQPGQGPKGLYHKVSLLSSSLATMVWARPCFLSFILLVARVAAVSVSTVLLFWGFRNMNSCIHYPCSVYLFPFRLNILLKKMVRINWNAFRVLWNFFSLFQQV